MNLPQSQKVDRKGLAVFLAVSFGLAWLIITVGDYFWDSAPAALAIHGTAMLAPGLACIVVRRSITKCGFEDIGLQPVQWRAYVLVILACLLLWGTPQLIDLSFSGHLRTFSSKRLILTIVYLVIGLIPAFGEELGWRGYLLPTLLPIGYRKALLLHGAIWGAWHWPLLFAKLLRGDIDIVHCIAGMIFMVPASAALGLIFGWLWLRFGSILLVSVLHFSYDYSRDVFALWCEPGRYSALLNTIPVFVIGGCALLVLLLKRPPAQMGDQTCVQAACEPKSGENVV